MILSQTAVYALKAVMYLAESDSDAPIRVDEIARELGVPRNYLSKILHALTIDGLLSSTRGPKGGFVLLPDPKDLSLARVVDHFDDVGKGPACLLGGQCSDTTPCAAHSRWRGVSSAVREFFSDTTVDDLSRHGPGTPPVNLG